MCDRDDLLAERPELRETAGMQIIPRPALVNCWVRSGDDLAATGPYPAAAICMMTRQATVNGALDPHRGAWEPRHGVGPRGFLKEEDPMDGAMYVLVLGPDFATDPWVLYTFVLWQDPSSPPAGADQA